MHWISRRAVGIIAVVVSLLVLGPTTLASAATTSKPYSLAIGTTSPTYETPGSGVVASGETVGITATFTNETSTQQIGSANLVAPSGFTVVGASVSPSGSASLANNCSVNGATVPACVALRNLSMAPGASATVTMSVATPACEQGGTFGWSAEVKQANNYNGTPGNDFFYDASGSQPDTTLDGACSLAFVPTNEPQDEILGNAIDGATPWFTGGGTAATPVIAEVLGPDGKTVVTGFTAPVTAGIAVNPGGGTLSGTNPQTPSNGTASFTDLEVNAAANGYELSASSGTLTSATSSAFDVASTFASCSGAGNSCHTDSTGNNGDGSLTASIVSGSGLLLESANANSGAQLTCSGSTSLDPNTYSFLTTGNLLANKVFTITMLGVKITGSVPKFLKAQQICFGVASATPNSALDFTTSGGTPAPYVTGGLPDGSNGYIGVLPNCTGSINGPCEDQNSASATLVGKTYTVELAADVPSSFPGDPYMR